MISYITRYTNLSSKRFLLHPKPQKNELLSSWLVRIALAHHTMPWSFMNMHFPEYQNIVFSRDVDIWAPESFVDKLAWKSGFSSEDIFTMTLRSYEGYLLERVRLNGPNFFISPIIPRKRRNLGYGQKYCPFCLQEDPAYFRKEWRLSFYTVCLEHKIHLLDRCQNCGLPVTAYKFKREQGFVQCYGCGWNLSKEGNLTIASDEELARVSRLMKILEKGYVLIGGKPVYSIAFFQGLHQIIKIVKHFGLAEPDNIDGILGKAENIIFNLQTEMKKLLLQHRICPSHLTQDMEYIPFYFWQVEITM
ncbi:TniQ family protein [Sulfuricurvum sp.]|uniref:TniQ family protein n=1 Tax=Sulfuricurvum sp. TaxID=2025608 RepID=UPI002639F7A9|nr:TniQ family protein [Sulfuricurvum sp.]MDD3596023.1 TniQ family protein [Sulfuricurvum sp.]